MDILCKSTAQWQRYIFRATGNSGDALPVLGKRILMPDGRTLHEAFKGIKSGHIHVEDADGECFDFVQTDDGQILLFVGDRDKVKFEDRAHEDFQRDAALTDPIDEDDEE